MTDSKPDLARAEPRRRWGPPRPIVVEDPGYVELTGAQRREAVAALADLLAAWWRRHSHETGLPALPAPAHPGNDTPDSNPAAE